MIRVRNPKSKVLTWESTGGLRVATLSQGKYALEKIPVEILPQTFIGKVRLLISLADEAGLRIGLNRYFDTVEYQEVNQHEPIKQEAVYAG